MFLHLYRTYLSAPDTKVSDLGPQSIGLSLIRKCSDGVWLTQFDC